MLQGRGSVGREQSAKRGIKGHIPSSAETPHDPAAVGVEPGLCFGGPMHLPKTKVEAELGKG